MNNYSPIGFFDSGYGGLTVLSEVRQQIPAYDFIYLGDNARAPYGPRSFDVVYEFTLEAVEFLFNQGCELVILACNTASAKALRTIQQKILPEKYPTKRVLGVIRPSTEAIHSFTRTNHVGILATEGTVKSESYIIEIAKFSPETHVVQHACPIWVPLIENNKHFSQAGKMLIEEDIKFILQKDPQIDTLILACTHYPILKPFIEEIVPKNIKVIAQGPIIAEKLMDYLMRHPELEQRCTKGNSIQFLTTENAHVFDQNASNLMKFEIHSQHIKL